MRRNTRTKMIKLESSKRRNLEIEGGGGGRRRERKEEEEEQEEETTNQANTQLLLGPTG